MQPGYTKATLCLFLFACFQGCVSIRGIKRSDSRMHRVCDLLAFVFWNAAIQNVADPNRNLSMHEMYFKVFRSDLGIARFELHYSASPDS